MLLVWAVPCERYTLHEDGTADLFSAGFDTFRVERLPAELDLTIVARLLLMEDEETALLVHVLGPSTTPLGELQHSIEARPGPTHREGHMVGQTEVLDIRRIPAATEGVYSVELYVEGAREAISVERHISLYFNVRAGLPQ